MKDMLNAKRRASGLSDGSWMSFSIGWLIKNEGFERLPLSQQVNDIIMIDGIPNGPLYFFPNGHYWSYSDYYSIRYRLSL